MLIEANMALTDFFDTKLGKNSIVLFFGASVAILGLNDLSRLHFKKYRSAYTSPIEREKIIRELHGQVNVKKISSRKRVEREYASKKRDEDWGKVKRFLKNLVP
jgi:hypothetical protein